MTKAVIFDAFGTLLKIGEGVHPFRQILRAGIEQGRRPKATDAKVLMTHALDLQGAADHFGITITPENLQRIQAQLDAELLSIQPFAEAQEAIDLLRVNHIKIAVCSNLAMPYGAAVGRVFPHLDVYGYSYAVGAMKPDPRIYQHVCDQLGTEVDQVVMIGDSQRCDRDGPREFGVKGFYLGRDGQGDFVDLLGFARAVIAGQVGT